MLSGQLGSAHLAARAKDTDDASGTATEPLRRPPRKDGSRGGLTGRGRLRGSGMNTRRRATRAMPSKRRVTASSQLRRKSSRNPCPDASSSSPQAAQHSLKICQGLGTELPSAVRVIVFPKPHCGASR